MSNATMRAQDAVHGSLAKCYVTIRGRRYNFMHLTHFESRMEINITNVPILGKVSRGNKPAGSAGRWSGTAHYNQSQMRVLADAYQKTGEMSYFEIQVTNEDPTATVGRQTITHHDCLFSDIVLAKFRAGDAVLDEVISGSFESWDIPETFRDLEGM